ncbi:MFS transporter [Thiotrichales bacterium 19S9-12]|nr:MFS transporter [Thiotrichales bacterium 19S9-11]MCF6811140.1 MFS transporter [Thiotrichales bacterium 19S9-12]
MKEKKLTNFFKLSFGNIIEWYDFSLYIYFANSITVSFFPSEDHHTGMLLTFFTFFLGFVARPLGGFLMGVIADRLSQTFAVNLCVILMGVTTFLIAFVPTYEQIGIYAPVVLVLFRILQGISVGGQFPGLISLSVDDYSKHKAFAISLVFSISSLGFLLASAVSYLMSLWMPDVNNQFSWRIAFASSAILFLIYLGLNYRLIKEPIKRNYQRNDRQLVVSLLLQWRLILAVICLTTMAASLYFLVFTYLVSYQIDYLLIKPQRAYFINTLTLVLACIGYPVFGFLADRFGYLKQFLLALILLLIFIIPLMWLIQTKASLLIFLALSIFTLLMTMMQGAVSPLFAAVFDQQWRTTGCALSYSIGNTIAGLAPFIAETLAFYDPSYGVSLFMLLLLLIGSVGMLIIFYKN